MIRKEYRYFASLALLLLSLLCYFCGLLPFLNTSLLPVLCLSIFFAELNSGHSKLAYRLFSGLLYVLTIVLAFFIASYRPEGFNYPLLWQRDFLYEGGQSFDLYANIAKGLCAYLLLCVLLKKQTVLPLTLSLIVCFVSAVLFVVSAHFIWGLAIEFKLFWGMLTFVAVNGLISVMAEEVFFRLLVQQKLQSLRSEVKYWPYFCWVFSAVLFALAHGIELNAVFALHLTAGLVYGGVYLVTRRFSMAVLLHLLVNCLHIVFLEYPMSIA